MIMGALLQSYIHFGLLFSWRPPIFLRDAFFMPYFVCAAVFLWGASCVRECVFFIRCCMYHLARAAEKGKKKTSIYSEGKASDDTFLLRPCAWDANAPKLRQRYNEI